MLNGIKVFSSDPVWRQILSDLGADVLDAPHFLAANMDELPLQLPVSTVELKSIILRSQTHDDVFKRLFGNSVPVFSALQQDIIVAIYKADGISGSDLRAILGFAPDVTTHTVDTAISQIRKIAGHDFIQNKNGKYIIGKL